MTNKIKLILVTALLSVMGLADVKAYTTADLEAAGWTKISSITNVNSNYYILVQTNNSTVIGLPNDGDGKARYRALADPMDYLCEVWMLASLGDNKYSIQRLSDSKYLMGLTVNVDYFGGYATESTLSSFTFTYTGSSYWQLNYTPNTGANNYVGAYGNGSGETGAGAYFDRESGYALNFDLYAIARSSFPKGPLKVVIDEADAITLPTENIGTGVFQYSQTRFDAFSTALSNAKTTFNNSSATESDCNSARTALESAMAEYDILNAPAADTRYYMFYHYTGRDYDGYAVTMYKGVNTDQGNYGAKYLTSTANANYGQAFVLTATATKNCYNFSYTTDEGATRYLCDGTVYSSASDDWIGRRIRTTDNASKALAIRIEYASTVSGTPRYTLINTTKNDGIGENNNNDMYTANAATFTFEEASKASVSVAALAAGKYATRIFPFKPSKVSGVTYYSCDAVDGSTLTLTEVDGELTANTPYILYAESATNAETLYGWGTAQQDSYTTGCLTGTYASTGNVPTGSYVLQTQDNKQAFYVVDDNDIALTPYRAYLTVPNTGARAILFPNEETTAINKLSGEVPAQIESIYQVNGTTSGRLVKGLNIVKMSDGSVKKIFVK